MMATQTSLRRTTPPPRPHCGHGRATPPTACFAARPPPAISCDDGRRPSRLASPFTFHPALWRGYDVPLPLPLFVLWRALSLPLPLSCVVLWQVISLEGWIDYATQTMDVLGPLSVVYFLIIVFGVTLFTLNLVLAVLKDRRVPAPDSCQHQTRAIRLPLLYIVL